MMPATEAGAAASAIVASARPDTSPARTGDPRDDACRSIGRVVALVSAVVSVPVLFGVVALLA